MDMQRTIRLCLQTDANADVALAETAAQFTAAFNEVCRVGWEGREKNGVRLHHLTYRTLKDDLPDLVSDLHIQARVKATEAVKSAMALEKKGQKVAGPRSAACSPRYNIHTFKVDWATRVARLSTTRGRIAVTFVLPSYFESLAGGKVCTADLIRRNGRWWLHVVIEIETPEIEQSSHVLGVDLGLNRPVVTSDRQFLGEHRWRDVEARLFRQKRQCQSKGTKSAKRRLRILRGRQARFRRDCDHVLSKHVVAACQPGGTIVVENLTNIQRRVKVRKGRQRRRLRGWSFAQLRGFIEYKAEAKGCRVVAVDPRHTSQACSRCGHQHRSNRKSQAEFECRNCGYRLDADLNGAINIRLKHQGLFGISVESRPPSTGPTTRKGQCGRA